MEKILASPVSDKGLVYVVCKYANYIRNSYNSKVKKKTQFKIGKGLI